MRDQSVDTTSRRTQLLTFVAGLLIVFSFIAGFMSEAGASTEHTRYNLHVAKVGFMIGHDLTVYLVPDDHRPCRISECRYRPYRHNSIGAVSVPMWIFAVLLPIGPVWWLRRNGRLRLRAQLELLA